MLVVVKNGTKPVTATESEDTEATCVARPANQRDFLLSTPTNEMQSHPSVRNIVQHRAHCTFATFI